MPTHGTFDVEISLAKGVIFSKIGLANGAILKLWAAHPCPKFSREPPPPGSDMTCLSTVTLGTRAKNNKKKKIRKERISFHLNFEALVPRVIYSETQTCSDEKLRHSSAVNFMAMKYLPNQSAIKFLILRKR